MLSPYSRILVVFDEAKGEHCLSRWLKPGFGHVYCIIPVGEDAGIVVEKSPRGLEIFLGDLAIPSGIVVECKAGKDLLLPVNLGSCVSITKRILGIWAPFCWTPYQLYRRLLREIAKETEKDR